MITSLFCFPCADVNVAHFQLMLLLHYGLSAEKQKEVFLALVKIVVDASNME